MEKANEARVKVWGFQSKLINHRPNKLKGVLWRSLRYWLGNVLRRLVLLIMMDVVGRFQDSL
jgi:hypothetical protein